MRFGISKFHAVDLYLTSVSIELIHWVLFIAFIEYSLVNPLPTASGITMVSLPKLHQNGDHRALIVADV